MLVEFITNRRVNQVLNSNAPDVKKALSGMSVAEIKNVASKISLSVEDDGSIVDVVGFLTSTVGEISRKLPEQSYKSWQDVGGLRSVKKKLESLVVWPGKVRPIRFNLTGRFRTIVCVCSTLSYTKIARCH